MIFEKIRPALFRAVYIHSWLLCASLLLIISVVTLGFSLGAHVSEFAPFIFNPPSRNMYLFLFPIPVALFIAFKSRKFLIENGKVNAQIFLKDYFKQLEQYVTGANFWNAIIALVAMLPIFVFFCLGKSMIPHLFSYTWDPMFADMDKYLHFGYYPHEFLVPIFEHYSLFAVAETVYFAFFIFLVGANGYAIFLVNASEFQPEAINTAYTARFSSAMLDHDTMGLIAGL